MAPSTPPPPSSERLAAFTIASTSSVVMSATTMSTAVWPISAESTVMCPSVSCAGRSSRGLKFQGGTRANIVIVRIQETPCGATAIGAQHFEKIVVSVEPTGGIQSLRRSRKSNAMNVNPPILPGADTARQLALIDQFSNEGDTAQLRHQRGVEGDLVDPRQDLVVRLRYLLALQWIDLNQQKVFGLGRADQRIERRVSDIATVPVCLTIDLYGAEEMRQACRGDDHVGGHFLAPEYVQLACSHIARGHEQLQILGRPDRLEIDKTADQILQWIDVERVEVVRRQITGHRLHPQADWRVFDRPERKQPVDGAALKVGQVACEAGCAPETCETLARFFRSTASETVGQNDGVDRAGRRAGNSLDCQSAIIEEVIEHAPGECAERAASLQCQVDVFSGFRSFRLAATECAGEEFDHCLRITAPPSRRRSSRQSPLSSPLRHCTRKRRARRCFQAL